MEINKNIAFCCLHYGGNFFREALMSVKDFVHKVHISYSKKPSQGFSTERFLPESEGETNLYNIAKEICGEKLIWETSEFFGSEELHRKERYKYSVGMKHIIVFDSDEILKNIPEAIEFVEQNNERFYGAMHFKHFIKGSKFYFQDCHRPIRIERLTVDNLDENLQLPLEVFHMSLAQSPEIIKYKLEISGHRNEIRPEFFSKWLDWSPEKIDEITDLHSTIPSLWHKPIPYAGSLPKQIESYKPKTKQKMRILFIPMDFQSHIEGPELFQDVIDAFNVSNQAMVYNGDMSTVIAFKPDVILFQASLSLADCIVLKRETGALFTMFTGDCRYAPMQSLIDYKDIVDAYLVPFSGVLLNTYTSILGKPCHFLFEFIQNWRFKQPKMMGSGEVVFVGNKYEDLPGIEGRNELDSFITRLCSLPVELYGNGFKAGEMINNKVPGIYNNAYIVIAENNHTVEDYFTPRNLGGLAAGSCVLMKYFPGIEKFFQNLVHCIYYKDKYELLQIIEFLKNNPTIRNEIASNGFGLAKTNFNMNAWTKAFMQIINKHYIK